MSLVTVGSRSQSEGYAVTSARAGRSFTTVMSEKGKECRSKNTHVENLQGVVSD